MDLRSNSVHDILAIVLIVLIVCVVVAVAIAVRKDEYKSSTPWFFTAFAIAAIAVVCTAILWH